jgi:xanthine dehydrogenase accessory factor
LLVLIKGAGDLASGIALRLRHARFDVVMTDIARPSAVRRAVCFSRAVYDGKADVEDVSARLVHRDDELRAALAAGIIPVLVDAGGECVKRLRPDVVVDAIMAKRNLGTALQDAPVVIALGPGFTAAVDCHAVIETMRGHTLGRLITKGAAIPNTGVPGDIGGHSSDRLLRAPVDGIFTAKAEIGARVKKGDAPASVRPGTGGEVPVIAQIDGVLRGILPSGFEVRRGFKAGDIDPRCERAHCFTVSDKALAIAGGVLEGILMFAGREQAP